MAVLDYEIKEALMSEKEVREAFEKHMLEVLNKDFCGSCNGNYFDEDWQKSWELWQAALKQTNGEVLSPWRARNGNGKSRSKTFQGIATAMAEQWNEQTLQRHANLKKEG